MKKKDTKIRLDVETYQTFPFPWYDKVIYNKNVF